MKTVPMSLLLLCAIALPSLSQENTLPQTSTSENMTEPYAVCDATSKAGDKCFYACGYRRRPVDAPCLTAPKPTYSPQPEYTDKARRKRTNGTVLLKIVLDNTGKVTAVDVLQGLEPSLDKQSQETVRTWKFEPAMLEGKPVAVTLPVEVTFRIR